MALCEQNHVQITSCWSKVSQDVEKSQKANEEWAAEQQAEKFTSKEGEPTQGDNGQGKSDGAK
jgi:hypothetical protein